MKSFDILNAIFLFLWIVFTLTAKLIFKTDIDITILGMLSYGLLFCSRLLFIPNMLYKGKPRKPDRAILIILSILLICCIVYGYFFSFDLAILSRIIWTGTILIIARMSYLLVKKYNMI